MGLAVNRTLPLPPLGPATRILLMLGIAAAGSAIVVVGSLYGTVIPAAAILSIPVAALFVLKPRVGVLITIFLLCFVEEFPGGISTDMFQRSERTAFYAVTLGIPALYAPDVLIGGLLGLYLLGEVFARRGLPIQIDKIALALILLGVAVLLSLLSSYLSAEPFGPPILDLSLVGSIELPEPVARLIAILQFKLFLLLIPSYLLGLFFFRTEQDVKNLLYVVAAAMTGTILLGIFRLVRDPSLVGNLVPIHYDTASVWLMALTIFYSVGMWSCGQYRSTRVMVQALFCAALALFILLSFRRTLWGAIAFSALLFPLILPARAYGRLLLLVAVGAIFGLVILGATPIGQALVGSLLARLGETNFNEASTLYRFALLVWFVERLADLPLLGYGLTPLWNEQIRLRFFVTHMENVHSLYFWILLRLGILGFLTSGVALALILSRIKQVYSNLEIIPYKILVGVVFLGIVIILFSGIFNPVYGRARFIIPMGLALAMVSRLPFIASSSRNPDATDANQRETPGN